MNDMNATAEALRGPWLAVLADRDGFVYPTFAEAMENLDEDEEMMIAVVRDSAMPTDGGDPEQLRMAGTYNAGDLIFEVDAYLIDPDDESLGAEARYAQAQAMADGLNAAGGAK